MARPKHDRAIYEKQGSDLIEPAKIYRSGRCVSWPRSVSSTHFSTSLSRSSMLFARRSFSYFIQHCPFASSGVSAACLAGAGAGADAGGAADCAGGGAATGAAEISAELLLWAQPPSARAQAAIDARTDFPIMRPS